MSNNDHYLFRTLQQLQNGQSDEDALAAAVAASLAESGLGPEEGEQVIVRRLSNTGSDEDDSNAESDDNDDDNYENDADNEEEDDDGDEDGDISGSEESSDNDNNDGGTSNEPSNSSDSESSSRVGRQGVASRFRRRIGIRKKKDKACDQKTLAYIKDWANKVESLDVEGINRTVEALLQASPCLDYGKEYDSDDGVVSESSLINELLHSIEASISAADLASVGFCTIESLRNINHSSLRSVGVPFFAERDKIMTLFQNQDYEELKTRAALAQFEPEDLSDDEGDDALLDGSDEHFIIRETLRQIGMNDAIPIFAEQGWVTLELCRVLTHIQLRNAGFHTFSSRHAIISAFEDTRNRNRLERERYERRAKRRKNRLRLLRKEKEAREGPPQLLGLRLKKVLKIQGFSPPAFPLNLRCSGDVEFFDLVMPPVDPNQVCWKVDNLSLTRVTGSADWLRSLAGIKQVRLESIPDAEEAIEALCEDDVLSCPSLSIHSCSGIEAICETIECDTLKISSCSDLRLVSQNLSCKFDMDVSYNPMLLTLSQKALSLGRSSITACQSLEYLSPETIYLSGSITMSNNQSLLALTPDEAIINPSSPRAVLDIRIFNSNLMEMVAESIQSSAYEHVSIHIDGSILSRGICPGSVGLYFSSLNISQCTPPQYFALDDADTVTSDCTVYSPHDSDSSDDELSCDNSKVGIEEILKGLRYQKYLPVFVHHGYTTLEKCATLDESTLRDWGLRDKQTQNTLVKAFKSVGEMQELASFIPVRSALIRAGLEGYMYIFLVHGITSIEACKGLNQAVLRSYGVPTFSERERIRNAFLNESDVDGSKKNRDIETENFVKEMLAFGEEHHSESSIVRYEDSFIRANFVSESSCKTLGTYDLFSRLGITSPIDRTAILWAIQEYPVFKQRSKDGEQDSQGEEGRISAATEGSDVSSIVSMETSTRLADLERATCNDQTRNQDRNSENDDQESLPSLDSTSSADRERQLFRKLLRRNLMSIGKIKWYPSLIRAGFDDVDKCSQASNKQMRSIGMLTRKVRKPIIACLRAAAKDFRAANSSVHMSKELKNLLEDLGQSALEDPLAKQGVLGLKTAGLRVTHDVLRNAGVARFSERRRILTVIHEALAAEYHAAVENGEINDDIIGSLRLAREAARAAEEAAEELFRAKEASPIYQALSGLDEAMEIYDSMTMQSLCTTRKLRRLTHDDLRKCGVISYPKRLYIIDAFRNIDLPRNYAEEGSDISEKSRRRRKEHNERQSDGIGDNRSSNSENSEWEHILAQLENAGLGRYSRLVFGAGCTSVEACTSVNAEMLRLCLPSLDETHPLYVLLRTMPEYSLPEPESDGDRPQEQLRVSMARSQRHTSRAPSRRSSRRSSLQEEDDLDPIMISRQAIIHIHQRDGPLAMQEVLSKIGLARYYPLFISAGCRSVASAKDLQHTSLRALGVSGFFDRDKILTAFRNSVITLPDDIGGLSDLDSASSVSSAIYSVASEAETTVHSDEGQEDVTAILYGSRHHIKAILQAVNLSYLCDAILQKLERTARGRTFLRAATRLSHEDLITIGIDNFHDRSAAIIAFRNAHARTLREQPVLELLKSVQLEHHWNVFQEHGITTILRCFQLTPARLRGLGFSHLDCVKFTIALRNFDDDDMSTGSLTDFENFSEPDDVDLYTEELERIYGILTEEDRAILDALVKEGLASYYPRFRELGIRSVERAQAMLPSDFESCQIVSPSRQAHLTEAFSNLSVTHSERLLLESSISDSQRGLDMLRFFLSSQAGYENQFDVLYSHQIRSVEACQRISWDDFVSWGLDPEPEIWGASDRREAFIDAALTFDPRDFVSDNSSGDEAPDGDEEGRRVRRESRVRRRKEVAERRAATAEFFRKSDRRSARAKWRKHLQRGINRSRTREYLEICQKRARAGPALRHLHGISADYVALSYCGSLETPGDLQPPDILNITNCRSLKNLNGFCLSRPKDPIGSMIEVSHCEEIETLFSPATCETYYQGRLTVTGCNKLKQLASGKLVCARLSKIKISNCDSFCNIADQVSLDFSHVSLASLKSLEALAFDGALVAKNLSSCRIVDCKSLQQVRIECIKSLSSLKVLECPELSVISPYCKVSGKVTLSSLPMLESCAVSTKSRMILQNLPKLQSLESPEGSLKHLKNLEVSNCPLLFHGPDSFGTSILSQLTFLVGLDLSNTSELTEIPDALPSKLRKLNLENCINLRLLPSTSMGRSNGYLELNVKGCKSLVSIPSQAHLSSLCAAECKSLRIVPRGLRVGRVKKRWENGFIVVDPKHPGNIDLSGCTALQHFGMSEVLGNLILSGAGLVEMPPVRVLGNIYGTHMPNLVTVRAGTLAGQVASYTHGRVVGGKVNFRHCPRLREVNLERVLHDLHLSYCPSLEKLGAQRLEIGVSDPGLDFYRKNGRVPDGSLHLQQCIALRELPAELICYESIDMQYCMALKSLANCKITVGYPALTKVDKASFAGLFRILGCNSLESLPRSMTVFGTLLLAMADEMVTLSALDIYGSVFAYQCLKLKQISRDVRVKGSLVLYECPELDSLPPNWAFSPPPSLSASAAKRVSTRSASSRKSLRSRLLRNRSSAASRIMNDYTVEVDKLDGTPEEIHQGSQTEAESWRDAGSENSPHRINASETDETDETDGRYFVRPRRPLDDESEEEDSTDESESEQDDEEEEEEGDWPDFNNIVAPEQSEDQKIAENGVSLYIIDCVSLSKLPKGLNIPGSLGIMGCGELVELPSDLQVGIDLILTGCVMLESVPHTVIQQMVNSAAKARKTLDAWQLKSNELADLQSKHAAAQHEASQARHAIQEIKRQARRKSIPLSVIDEQLDKEDESETHLSEGAKADIDYSSDVELAPQEIASQRKDSLKSSKNGIPEQSSSRQLSFMGRRSSSASKSSSSLASRALGHLKRSFRRPNSRKMSISSSGSVASAISTASSQLSFTTEEEERLSELARSLAIAEEEEEALATKLAKFNLPAKPCVTLYHVINLAQTLLDEDTDFVVEWRAKREEINDAVQFTFSDDDGASLRASVTGLISTEDHREASNDYAGGDDGNDGEDEEDDEYEYFETLDDAVRFWSKAAGWVDKRGLPVTPEAKSLYAKAQSDYEAKQAKRKSYEKRRNSRRTSRTSHRSHSSQIHTSEADGDGDGVDNNIFEDGKFLPIVNIKDCIEEAYKGDVLRFLEKLKSSTEYDDRSMRRGLAERVMEIIRLLAEDPESSEDIVLRMSQSIDACVDKPIWALNQMHVVQEIAHARGDRERIRSLGRRVMRLGLVHEAAAMSIAKRGGYTGTDDVCVYLRYEIDLRVPLNLPVSSRDMRYGAYVNIPTSEIFEVCRKLRTITEDDFEAWLSQWSEWQRQLRFEFARDTKWEDLPSKDRRVSLGRTDLMGDELVDPVEIERAVFSFSELMRFWVPSGVDLYKTPRSVEDMKTSLYRCIPAIDPDSLQDGGNPV